ncbi:MAG: hypothetical protein IPL91_15240 [Hyphomicrobium sp.]|nr:hypothetical protein [Hyphomicrobium sp.]
MSSTSKNSIIFNIAGAGVLLTVAGYIVTSFITTPAVLPCTQRFPAGHQLSFDGPGGRAMSAIDLQARFGTRQWGLSKNVEIVKAGGKSTVNSLEVTLAPIDDDEGTTQNGVGFTWAPQGLEKGTSACLSYSVFLPDGFGFNEPGHMPGLYGASDVTQIDELAPSDSFAVRVGWGQAGDSGLDVRIPDSSGYWETPPRKAIWPTGRWVSVEQEIKLNTPDQADGYVRLWIDGALTINRGSIILRKSAQSGLSGVVSDIRYARTVSKLAKIRVSPFVLQWQ